MRSVCTVALSFAEDAIRAGWLTRLFGGKRLLPLQRRLMLQSLGRLVPKVGKQVSPLFTTGHPAAGQFC